MNKIHYKVMTIALGLTIFAASAQASTLSITADSNFSDSEEQFQFSSAAFSGESFSDVISLEITPFRSLLASVSGTSNIGINFSTFDLYSGVFGGENTLVQTGESISFTPRLSFGSIDNVDGLFGNYFILIEGTQFGASSYNGNITLTGINQISPVPAPAALPLMLSGLALLGFVKRRKTA